jgi:hypothetical protein
MKQIILILLTTTFVVGLAFGCELPGSGSFEMPASILNEQATENDTSKIVYEITGSFNLKSIINRGDLDIWWRERTGGGKDAADNGSPAFYNFGFTSFYPFSKRAYLGAGLDFYKFGSHAIWGSDIFYGGGQSIVLNPIIMVFKTPVRFYFSKKESFTLSPALLIGGVSGTRSIGFEEYDVLLQKKFGFGMSMSYEYFFKKFLGVSVCVGMRMLKTPLMILENSSSGYSYEHQLLNNHNRVQVDLGGSYLIIGAVLDFHLPSHRGR